MVKGRLVTFGEVSAAVPVRESFGVEGVRRNEGSVSDHRGTFVMMPHCEW